MIASTLREISASNCSACFGRLPSEWSSVTFQPLPLAASAAALATRACVSAEDWNPITPTSNACAPVAASSKAQTKPMILSIPPPLLERGLFQHGARDRDGREDDGTERDVLHVVGGPHQHEAVAQHLERERGEEGAGDVGP